jgi:hypothetical protein
VLTQKKRAEDTMQMLRSRLVELRMEAVTATFVAAGAPAGIHDLGRLLENLNNTTLAHHIELHEPAVRPLYRAALPLQLEAPMLVQRDEIIFVNFEGPYFHRGAVRAREVDVPVLLLAPPFQIQGNVSLQPGAEPTQALRSALQQFFVVRHARVFDADGTPLGEGEQIVVNGSAVVMTSATQRHIPALAETPARRSTTLTPVDATEPEEQRVRAA